MTTLKDIALAANVTPMTVSRVINTPELVKPKTKEKVLAVMEELQYRPNMAAKNLVSKRTGVIDVFIPESIDLSNPFVMHFIAGISKTLSARMYSFLILRNKHVNRVCDGYIVTGLLSDEIEDFIEFTKQNERPIVLFGHTDLPNVVCIDVDNISGAKMAVEYLIKKGHKKIAMINVNEKKDYTIDRKLGYLSAMHKYGLHAEEEDIIYVDNSVIGGEEAIKKLLCKGDMPTAIFCATDTIAIGVARQLEIQGYSVPRDISLIGFDGLGHHNFTNPNLTTIQQPIFEIGTKLAQILLDRIDGNMEKEDNLIQPILLEQNSVLNLKN